MSARALLGRMFGRLKPRVVEKPRAAEKRDSVNAVASAGPQRGVTERRYFSVREWGLRKERARMARSSRRGNR